MKHLFENWRDFEESSSPKDFLYDITTSSSAITINLLNPATKEPVESKKKGTDAYISIEKRTGVPNWEVAWSSSPANSKEVGTIMYLMALELAGNDGLSPDSYETSTQAEGVWAKFMPKGNMYGVLKKKKKEYMDSSDDNPFFFVFFKPNKVVLSEYEDKITEKEVEKVEKEEEMEVFEPFDPHNVDFDEFLRDINENIAYEDTDKVSKVVIYDKNGQILLLQRSDGRNDWDLPGGHLKKGENHEEGARRETKEETDLAISSPKHVKTHEHIEFFKCPCPKGDVKLDPNEHIDFKWVNPKDINQFNMRKSIKSAILDAIKLFTEDFQQDVKKGYSKMKFKLLGKGPNKYNVGGEMKKPSYKRSKSAPAGFGGS